MKTQSGNAKLCAIEDSGQIRALATEPAFVCSRCGAKAHEAANLCDAVQLPEPGWGGD